MELKVNEVQIPEKISFNYEELKKELTSKVSTYETMVYTDNQIKDAKADKASLNKLKKALNDERIKREKDYMKPFNEFKTQVNEIISIIDKPVQVIDQQVKAYEEKQKDEKRESISDYWNSIEHPESLDFNKIFDEKWLNASVSMNKIQEAITESIQQFSKDMATLATLPEYSFEAQQSYISSRDIGQALNEVNRLSEVAKKKAEADKRSAELKAEFEAARMKRSEEEFISDGIEQATSEESFIPSFDEIVKPSWIGFKALMTKKQVDELMQFFTDRQIQFTI